MGSAAVDCLGQVLHTGCERRATQKRAAAMRIAWENFTTDDPKLEWDTELDEDEVEVDQSFEVEEPPEFVVVGEDGNWRKANEPKRS
jgi:hypothetical protein